MAKHDENQAPRHKHDCDECVFLGHAGEYDLYFHDGGERTALTTLIARYGEDGSYFSGLAFSLRGGIPPLITARSFAIDRGFAAAIAKAEGTPL